MAGSLTDYEEDQVLARYRVGNWYLGLISDTNTPAQRDAGVFTEISGGGMARQLVTWIAGGGGNWNNGAINFPAVSADLGQATGWVLWDALAFGTGNPRAWGELLGPAKVYTVDPTTDIFTSNGHGFTNGTRVRVRNTNGTNPTGLSEATVYYVINVTANTFQLSLTSGGAAVDVTAVGTGTQRVHQDWFTTIPNGAQVTFPANSLVMTLD